MKVLRRQVFILALSVLILGVAVLLLAVRPTAQDAPTPSQGGAGRPETPGVASMSTPAPRSGLNVISVPATSSPGERNLSGSIGAPTEVRVKPPAERRLLDRQEGAPLFARTGIGSAAFGGLATWYATPGFTAAAGPDLRAIAGWRGLLVKVTSRGKSVIVRLTDACWCPPRNGRPVLLDLSRLAFSRLATPSTGVIVVQVEVGGRLPRLPATSTEEGYGP